MKAAVRSKYGSPEVLSIKELDIPTPKDNELLIKVHAATVNRSDCHVLTGKPYAMRLFTGLPKPKSAVTGSDFAGEITAIGKAVTSFKPGEKVMGFLGGLGGRTHAQYFIVTESLALKAIVTMPAHQTYEEAAASLEGAFYAINAVKSLDPKPGQKALVIGATGAIGAATVQFLKYYGVNVTGILSNPFSTFVIIYCIILSSASTFTSCLSSTITSTSIEPEDLTPVNWSRCLVCVSILPLPVTERHEQKIMANVIAVNSLVIKQF